MLIDMHAHSSGISHCCKSDARTIIQKTKEVGIDGMILTNHYTKSYIIDNDLNGFVEKYINEYHLAAKCGEELGFKVFFGLEVTMEFDKRVHMLVYGVSEDFLRTHPALYDMTQEELYQVVNENGGILVQAHPFRGGTTILDTNYLNGIEINCHPKYGSTYSSEILQTAKEKHLLVTCGADFHDDVPYRPDCGVHFPEEIKNTEELVHVLCSEDTTHLRIQELHAPDSYEQLFTK